MNSYYSESVIDETTSGVDNRPEEVVELNDVGSRIRALRQRRGLSQEQLGAECAFSQPKISKMENGACDSLSDLKVIGQALGVGIEELICPSPPLDATDVLTETEND